ncbi:unnamed protein product [Rhodiola kirilowii]
MDSDEIDETTLSTVEVFKIPTQDEFDRDYLESLDIDSEEGYMEVPIGVVQDNNSLWDFPPFNDVSAWINHQAINDHGSHNEQFNTKELRKGGLFLSKECKDECQWELRASKKKKEAEWHYTSRVLRQFGWRQPEPALPPASHKEMHMHIRRTAHLVDDVMQGYIDLWDNRAANIVTGEPDADGSYLDPYYSWYNTVTRKRIQPPLYTPETYRPSGHEHYLLVASVVRTCKMSASMFFKTTDKEVKRQLHDMFHATRADLLKIGEGRALDVDVTQIHLLSDSDEDLDLPHDTFDVGPSQVTQAESQRGPLRWRLMPPWQHYATMSGIWGAKDHLSLRRSQQERLNIRTLHEPALPLKPRFDPTRVTLLSWSPRAFHYKGFLSDKECDHLISLTNGRLGKSMVADSKTGKGVESKVRTSSGTFLDYAQDEIVADIEARIATWTFLPIENGEAMQVLRYELGQKYEPHRDYFTDKHNQRFGGHRVATVLMYLSNVIKGGETIFPLAEGGLLQQKGDDWSDCAKRGYAVKPRKGDALLFFGLHLNGTTDPKSLHGSCPVIEGEKWSATKWIRVRPLFMPDASCTDENEHCPDWAVHGECERNSNYMVGVNNTGGHCMKSCGVCSDTA